MTLFNQLIYKGILFKPFPSIKEAVTIFVSLKRNLFHPGGKDRKIGGLGDEEMKDHFSIVYLKRFRLKFLHG